MSNELLYGCLFCKTGSEHEVANRINEIAGENAAIVPIKLRKRYHDGECIIEKVTLLPGYVFFRIAPDTRIAPIEEIPSALRVLKYTDESWYLREFDLEFALFFFMNSEIEYSKAEFVDGHIHFIDGFLKGHDNNVIRLNKRMKTVEVKLDICEATIWVGYDLT